MSESLCHKNRQIFLYTVNQTSQDNHKYCHEGKTYLQQIPLHIQVHSPLLSLINWVHIILSKSRFTRASTFLTFFFTFICCIICTTNILPSEALTTFSVLVFVHFLIQLRNIQTAHMGISKTYHTFSHIIFKHNNVHHIGSSKLRKH